MQVFGVMSFRWKLVCILIKAQSARVVQAVSRDGVFVVIQTPYHAEACLHSALRCATRATEYISKGVLDLLDRGR